MMVVLQIAYDGTRYSGWQRQADTSETIQEKIELAAAVVADHEVDVYCAGRTDAGVHATSQVAHFETGANRTERSWLRGINTGLPDDITIRHVRILHDKNFHARYSAISRKYLYVIDNDRNTGIGPNIHRCTWIYRPLDETLMKKAGRYLVGEHDFSAFRSSICQARSAVKTMHSVDIERNGRFLIMRFHANAFLHHMVRNIAGVLIAIGCGDQPVRWCRDVLESRDRTLGGVTAKPDGVYLAGVQYPDHYGLTFEEGGILIIR